MNIKKNLQLVCIKCQMFWKCNELVAAKNPTRAVSWVRAWWFILRPRLISALVRRYFSVSPAKYASSSFTLIFLSLLFTHDLSWSWATPWFYCFFFAAFLRRGRRQFLVPFSCLHQKALSSCPDKTVSSSKFLKGIIDRDRWESCQNTSGKSNHC